MADRARYFIAVLLGTCAIAGCGKEESAQKLMEQARLAYEKGDRQAAVIHLRNALDKNPVNSEAQLTLGRIYLELGDMRSAEQQFRKAQQVGAAPGTAEALIGLALLKAREFKRVLDEIKPAHEMHPDTAAAVVTVRGQAYLGLDRPAQAQEAFDDALKFSADHPGALVGLARLALSRNDANAALALVDRALLKAPKEIDAWFLKGDLLRDSQRYDESLAAYQQVLALHPGNAMAYFARAAVHLASGKDAAALPEVEAARKRAPNHPIGNYLLAFIQFRNGEHRQALISAQESLKAANYPPAHLLAAAAAFITGALQQAEEHAAKYLRAIPGDAYARKLHAATLIRLNEPKKALGVLQPMLGGGDAEALGLGAEAHMQAKEFAAATELFARAAAAEPGSADRRTGLALSQLARGDTGRAVVELEAAAKLPTSDARAQVLLVMTHLSQKAFDRALEAARSFEQKHPRNPIAPQLLGQVLLARKDSAGARKQFERALNLQAAYFPAAAALAQLDAAEGKREAAMRRFEAVLAADDKSLPAMTALAQLAASAGDTAAAMQWLERARNSDIQAWRPRVLLTALLLRSGEAGAALVVAVEAQSIAPQNPDVLDAVGSAHLAQGNHKEALVAYQRLATVAPKSPVALLRLGSAQAAGGDYRAAEASARKAVALKPDFVEARLALGSVLIQAGRHADARAVAVELTQREPKSPTGLALSGDVSMAEKKYPEAAQAYESAYRLRADGAIAGRIYTALAQAGKPQADARLRQWLDAHPEDAGTRLTLADSYARSRQYPLAVEQYERVLKTQPGSAAALNNLAWVYQQQKDPKALALAQKAHQLRPDSATFADTLGWILVEKGDLPRGIELLKKAAALDAKAVEPRYHLALALARSGDKASALRELRALLDAGKKLPPEAEAEAAKLLQ